MIIDVIFLFLKLVTIVFILFYFHFNPCPLGTDNGLVVGTDKIIISLKINLYSTRLALDIRSEKVVKISLAAEKSDAQV